MVSKISAYQIKEALAKKHKVLGDFFLTEVKTGATWGATGFQKIDALAIKKSWATPCFTGYEIKVNRNDFLSDEKWTGYLPYCHRFNFVCPKGLIDVSEIDKNVGLIYYNPDKSTLRTKKKSVFRNVEIPAEILYYIILSKIDSPPYPFFSNAKEYFQAWLDNKLSNQDMSYRIKSKIISELKELEIDKKRLEIFEQQHGILNQLIDKIRIHSSIKWVNYENVIERFDELMNNKETRYKIIVEKIEDILKRERR